ncbi:hypothetical protein ACIQF6_34590 [Kitasatospora sp. NPDC092948]
MSTITAELEFDLDLDLEIVVEEGAVAGAKSFTLTGTCLSCPITSWLC